MFFYYIYNRTSKTIGPSVWKRERKKGKAMAVLDQLCPTRTRPPARTTLATKAREIDPIETVPIDQRRWPTSRTQTPTTSPPRRSPTTGAGSDRYAPERTAPARSSPSPAPWVLLYCRSSHASTAVRVLAGLGLGVALGCFLVGALFFAVTLGFCVHGNLEGKQQPHVAAVDL